MYSIRDRLLWTFAIVVLLTGIAATYMTFISARGQVDSLLDMQLKQVAISLESHVAAEQRIQRQVERNEEQFVVQWIDRETQRVHVSHKITPFPYSEQTGFSTIRHDGETWRLYTLVADRTIIVSAQPTDIRVGLAFSSALHILQPLVLLLPFLAIAVWLVVGQGLSSLNRTAKFVAQRSPTSLAPIPTQGLPQEALGLVNALNGLLTRLQESLESQRRFASDAAHELRTPLTALKLQIQLAERAKTPEAQHKAFSRLHEGIERATRLVQQLLTIARLDPDATQKPFVAVALEKVLQSTHDELSVVAEQKAITITTDLQATTVNGMEDALKLLVTNLTDNAIRYTPEGGKIRLRVTQVNNRAVIEISDNGPGIAAEERDRIFDRFYRALGTKTQGHGLGLAIVKRIVELHQGEIRVEDGLEDRGTTMRIELPLPK
ncbi:MAG: GHKL domain-containing protein [Burkholderiaceae bacterium]|nr:GHKL domain-containing protein [Burkholderiaceae bacterium]MBR5459052.1 GHKL domain-containing protein [Burkholderiaceae bacterium]